MAWQHGTPHVVTDHSASDLNDGIPKEEASVKYDDMHIFGQVLFDAKENHPNHHFKSNVAMAFLNLPAHPLWQLQQVVVVDGHLYILQCFIFGNQASPRCWCAISGLMCWITSRKLDVKDLNVYMDDFFRWDFADNLVFYRGQWHPQQQVQLLLLWEFLCCPFNDKKQEHGEKLKIIGFWVDINLGTISIPPASISKIIMKIEAFLQSANRRLPL
jgi:hypothetical protein